MDATWISEEDALRERYVKRKNKEYSNLRAGEFDYAVIFEFPAIPWVDVCLGKIDLRQWGGYCKRIFGDPDRDKSNSNTKKEKDELIIY